jgi:hypothetical protein
MSDLLHPKRLRQLRGDEGLAPGLTVRDFWRWALGDLRMNTARGYLVEYLVAQALKDETRVRVEWGPYDARGLDGTLVEIKTRAISRAGSRGALDAVVVIQERPSRQSLVGRAGCLPPDRPGHPGPRLGVRVADL